MAPFLENLMTMVIEDIVALSKDPDAAQHSVRYLYTEDSPAGVRIISGTKENTGSNRPDDVQAPDIEEFTKMLTTVWTLGKSFVGKK